MQKPFELTGALQEIEDFSRWSISQERFLFQQGRPLRHPADFQGDAKDRPLGMVHFDAHCDTGDDYLGSKFHHGAPFRRAVEEGLLDPQRTIQIGIRGPLNDPDVWKFSEDSGMRVVSIEEFYDSGWRL